MQALDRTKRKSGADWTVDLAGAAGLQRDQQQGYHGPSWEKAASTNTALQLYTMMGFGVVDICLLRPADTTTDSLTDTLDVR